MTIIDRFSTHLREVLIRSIRIATDLKSQFVETEHLLSALAMQKGSVAHEILTRFGINVALIQKSLPPSPDLTVVVTDETQAKQEVLAPFSEVAKICLERAMLYAQDNGHNFVGTEHLLAALVDTKDDWLREFFIKNKINPDELKRQAEVMLSSAAQFNNSDNLPEVIDRISENTGDDFGAQSMPLELDLRRARKKESALDYFAVNLSAPEMQSKIDPVIGRENEIERMIQILCRRTKNNPVLLGEPGTGKTAIVEGLAKKIAEGDVPELLMDKKVYSLDMGLLIAGTTFRGEFEARLKQVADELAHDQNIILFIDEIHNIVGAGSSQGTLDAANILKPVLARGQARCIGATTPAEFKKYIESDAALERRFQPIFIKESSVEDAIKILKGIKKNYEKYHNLKISDKAIIAAVRLSDRYVANKFMPDKAIDLLDEAAAAKKLKIKPTAESIKLRQSQNKLQEIVVAKEKAVQQEKFEEAVKLKDRQYRLEKEIAKLLKQKKAKNKPDGILNEKDIAAQLVKMIDADNNSLSLEENDILSALADELKTKIIGQDNTILEVAKTVRQARLGLSNPNRPLASFMFVGSSGVGKTELAKSLAFALHKNTNALIHLNMSEFNESFGTSKLLGSPAGYVGFRESTQFTDKVKINPHCVILFDEIDKAHKDVTRLLLQMLENGEITDSTGRKISLKHAIIIMTTTTGSEEAKKSAFGFGAGEFALTEKKAKLVEKLKDFFSPELINRIDKICLFNNLETAELAMAAALEIKLLNIQLTKFKTSLLTDQTTMQNIVKTLPQQNISARVVRREIRSLVEGLISDIVMAGRTKKTYKILLEENKIKVK